MITVIRKNQRWLVLIIAIMTIIAFAWLYNTTDTEQIGANQVASMYGKTVFQPDIDRAVRIYQLAAILGMEEFLGRMTGTARNPDEALEEFVWNLMVLRHEAGMLWVNQTSEQILEGIRALPALRSEEGFDRMRYLRLLQEELAPRGLTERHLEDLVRDSLNLRRVAELVASPVGIGRGEGSEIEKLLRPVDVEVVQIPHPETPPEVGVTQQEIEEFYQQNRAMLQTPEFRNAELAVIRLAPEKAALEGRERVDALQEAAGRISRLHDLLEAEAASLQDAVEQTGASLSESGWVDARGLRPAEDAAGTGEPSALPPALVAEIFRLREERPLGEIVQTGDEFYVALLRNTREPRELAIAEVSAKIRELLEAQKQTGAIQERANAAHRQIVAAVEGGAGLEDAARAAGATVEILANAKPWETEDPRAAMLAQSTLSLDAGEKSGLQPGPDGFFFVRLAERHPPDPAAVAAQGSELRSNLLEAKGALLLSEWFRVSRENSGLRLLRGAQGR